MKIKTLLLSIFFSISYNVHCQPINPFFQLVKGPFINGTIIYKNGKEIQGLMTTPKYFEDSKITYKSSEKAPEQKLDCENMRYMKITSKTGSSYLFEYTPISERIKSKPGKEGWLLVEVSGYATLYAMGDYYVDADGDISLLLKKNISDVAKYRCYLKKGDNDIAYFFVKTTEDEEMNRMNKKLLEAANLFLSDDIELISQIRTGKYGNQDIQEIITIYNEKKQSINN